VHREDHRIRLLKQHRAERMPPHLTRRLGRLGVPASARCKCALQVRVASARCKCALQVRVASARCKRALQVRPLRPCRRVLRSAESAKSAESAIVPLARGCALSRVHRCGRPQLEVADLVCEHTHADTLAALAHPHKRVAHDLSAKLSLGLPSVGNASTALLCRIGGAVNGLAM
jgi:hypothetical protein